MTFDMRVISSRCTISHLVQFVQSKLRNYSLEHQRRQRSCSIKEDKGHVPSYNEQSVDISIHSNLYREYRINLVVVRHQFLKFHTVSHLICCKSPKCTQCIGADSLLNIANSWVHCMIMQTFISLYHT